jgi:hypothetical protein
MSGSNWLKPQGGPPPPHREQQKTCDGLGRPFDVRGPKTPPSGHANEGIF